jgi:hypothetical protein
MEQPARAYTRFVGLVLELSLGVLNADECRCLRDAADARFFGDDDSDLHDANADVLLLVLETSRRLRLGELDDIRTALHAVEAVGIRRAAA